MASAEETVAMTLLAIAAIVALARLMGALARRVHQPAVVGEILAGIMLGPSLLGAIYWGGLSLDEHLFPEPVRAQLLALANLGLVIFMFVVGLELDLRRIGSQRRQAFAVSLSSVALPMACAAILSVVLWSAHGPGGGTADRVAFALFMGVAMAVTAFPVLARILTERRMTQTQLGSLALAAAAVDDVLAWSLLAVATTVAGVAGQPAWVTVAAVAGFVLAMVTLVRPFAAALVRRYERAGRLTPDIFGAVLIGILVSAWVTDRIGIHFIFGAFLFGYVFPRDATPEFVRALLDRLEDISVLVLLPVFFVMTGLNVDVTGLSGDGLLVLAAVVVLAVTTKLLGTYAAARATGVRSRPASALGVLMNTRGLTEVVVVNVGFMAGLLDEDLLTVFIVMAVLTTIMTEPLLRAVYPDTLVRRDIAIAERTALGLGHDRRVLVTLRGEPVDEAAVRVARMLLGRSSPGTVVLSRVVAPRLPRGELGSGLAGELTSVADALEGTSTLTATPSGSTAGTLPLTRLGSDPVGEWCAQADDLDVEAVLVGTSTPEDDLVRRLLAECSRRVVVVGAPPAWTAPPTAVRVTDVEGPHGPAVFEVGARLALENDLPFLLDGTPGARARRTAGWLRRARAAGLDVLDADRPDAARYAGDGAVLVGPAARPAVPVSESTMGLLVRAGSDEPVDQLDVTLDSLTHRPPAHPQVPAGNLRP